MNRTRTLLLIAVLSGACLNISAQTMLDRIIAVVDKEIITESELNERVSFLAIQNRLDATSPELRKQVLDGMVTEKLVLAQAIIDSVEVTDEEVNRALDQQVQNFIRQVGSEERVEQIYGKPISRIKREYRDEIRQQLLVQKVRQQREAGLQVTRREAEEFYAAYRDSLPQVPEEFTVSHLFVVPQPDSNIERATRERLTLIRDSIMAGGDFADFARRYSIDGTAAGGGDLGWARRGDYVREFEEAVFGLQPGQTSPVIKTQYGFHVVQLVERRGEQVRARHILLRVERGAESDSAAVRFLVALRDSAVAGTPFADLARRHSQDEETRAQGGDLGTLTADQFVPEFASTVMSLQAGTISQPSRANFGTSVGWHIVWLQKRTPAHAMTVETDYDRVAQVALYVKRNRLNAEWVEELKRTIHLDIRL
ncbi:MAG: peptidylprolyl isomerase [Bacteroidetes bacterium]|jgi:peptidyl-prolyl cis-trans isomerase SurA|nr:peptidylprolyl isomerase [Bacteroidota bacterium]